MRVGGPAARLVTVETTDELVDAVREVDDADEPLLVLSGGSNLVVSDDGFEGTVVHIATSGIEPESADLCGGAMVQNVGAYGQDVSQTVAQVRTWDRQEQAVRTFVNADCAFTYRHSRFKGHSRYVVLDVLFQFEVATLSRPVAYAALAKGLGAELGARVPLSDARDAVLEQRRSRGMVLDDADPDTWSCGSFFTNPVLSRREFDDLVERVGERLGWEGPTPPCFPESDGRVKTSAAWLIDQAGFAKGFGLPAPAALSTKHTLAVTNRGGATASDVLDLARQVRDGVQEAFGVTLVNEPVILGDRL